MLILGALGMLIVAVILKRGVLAILGAALLVLAFGYGASPAHVLAVLGREFRSQRFLLLFIIAIPAFALLDRIGLRTEILAFAKRVKLRSAAVAMVGYLVFRQATSAIGLNSLGGHVQMVVPVVAPLAEQAQEAKSPDMPDRVRQRIRALAAATENVGSFFGQNMFAAFSSVLLATSFFKSRGFTITPEQVASWSVIPAIAAFVVHALVVAVSVSRAAQD